MEIVAADLGGTNARFAIAEIAGGRIVRLEPETVVRTGEHASLETAWEAFERAIGRPAPRRAAIAVAGPVDPGAPIKMTNSPWMIRPAEVKARLGLSDLLFLNDFAAVAHAVAALPSDQLMPVCGPDAPLPDPGVISVVGPGTGLGVAILVNGPYGAEVIPTEGGHMDFAPLDTVEDALLARMRGHHGRVSVERVCAGPGLRQIYATLAAIEGRAIPPGDDAALWISAFAGDDSLAVAALDRFCMTLGSVAGDLALAHGAGAVVIAGGVGLRLAGRLPDSGFRSRFTAKGRYEARMARLPVRLVTHPQPGLIGAAAAFASGLRRQAGPAAAAQPPLPG